MTMKERHIHYDDIESAKVDALLELPYAELEHHIREAGSILDKATLLNDRLRAVRMEKIRQDCIKRSAVKKGGA